MNTVLSGLHFCHFSPNGMGNWLIRERCTGNKGWLEYRVDIEEISTCGIRRHDGTNDGTRRTLPPITYDPLVSLSFSSSPPPPLPPPSFLYKVRCGLYLVVVRMTSRFLCEKTCSEATPRCAVYIYIIYSILCRVRDEGLPGYEGNTNGYICIYIYIWLFFCCCCALFFFPSSSVLSPLSLLIFILSISPSRHAGGKMRERGRYGGDSRFVMLIGHVSNGKSLSDVRILFNLALIFFIVGNSHAETKNKPSWTLTIISRRYFFIESPLPRLFYSRVWLYIYTYIKKNTSYPHVF